MFTQIKLKYTYKSNVNALILCTLLCHVMLFCVFFFNGVTMMWLFNIFSVVTYCICLLPALKNSPWVLYKVFFIEILVHYLLASFCLGNNFAFFAHAIMLIPLCHYCDYASGHKEKRWISRPVYILVVFLIIIFGQLIGVYYKPMYVIEESGLTFLLTTFNILIGTYAVSNIMTQFHEKINAIENQLTAENSELNIEAQTDVLTGLYNRRHADEVLGDYIADGQLFSIVLFDLDDFKQINDTRGHDCGDYVLKTVSENIVQSLRKTDVVCRWGGEEILVIMPHCDSEETVRRADNIRKIIADFPFKYETNEFEVTITGGIAEYSEGDTALDLFNTADKNLYMGKKRGKNCIV